VQNQDDTIAAAIARRGPIRDWISDLLAGYPSGVQTLILIGVGIAAAWLVWRVVLGVARLLDGRTGRTPMSVLVERSRLSGLVLLIGIGLANAFMIGRDRNMLPAVVEGRWDKVVSIWIILAGTWLVIRVIGGAGEMLVARVSTGSENDLKARQIETQVAVISRIMIVVAAILGVGIALMTFEQVERIGASLLASAGIAGIVVGFAARPLLENIIAGVQIALTQPVKLGDAVVIRGEWGWIEDITTTYVVVRIWDQRRLIVPFSTVISEPFENWTRRNSEITGRVILYADYRCPVDEIRAEFERIIENNPKWDGRGKAVQVTDCTERSMEIRILVTAKDSPTAFELRCEVREKLIAFLQREHERSLPRERETEITVPRNRIERTKIEGSIDDDDGEDGDEDRP